MSFSWFKKQYINEVSGFEKNVWVNLTDEEKDEFAEEIFDLINTAYSPIGGNPNYKSPNAVKITKNKSAGNKSVGMGHDNSKPAKSAAVNITAIMLKEPGHYVDSKSKRCSSSY